MFVPLDQIAEMDDDQRKWLQSIGINKGYFDGFHEDGKPEFVILKEKG